MAVVLVAVVLVVVGVRTLTGNDSDDSDVASATFTESPAGEDSSDAPATVTTVTVAPEEETEESGTPTVAPLPESAPEPSHEDATSHSGSGPLACDGRGVFIVQTVKGDSGDVAGEIGNGLTAHPGSVLMPPGSCPSLRAHSDHADNYAVVIDYGDDLDSLCAAERNGGGNARLLNSDTSYASPC